MHLGLGLTVSNQVIYDRIWASRKLASCSLKAALAYPWIYLVADDWGRFEYLPRVIWGRVFGAREDVRARDVEGWLAEYERVGLLHVYEVGGRRIGRWHRFVGPPPSKRSPSILPDESGRIDTEGLKRAARFHSAPDGFPQAEAEAEAGSGSGSGNLETTSASGKRRAEALPAPPPPPLAPAGIDHDPHDPLQVAIARRCEELAAKDGDTTPREVLRAVSLTPGGKTLDSLRRASKSWLEQTLRSCEDFEADLVGQGDEEDLPHEPERPPPREPT